MNFDDNHNSDEELDLQLLNAGKEGIVFLVDATEPMFDLEQFSLAIKCVESVMKNKAIAQPSHETALILFGTEKTLNDESFDNISVVNKMQKSSAQLIKALNEQHLRQKFGHNNQFSLAEVFSLAIEEFNQRKFQSKRVILFTSTSNPYPSDSPEDQLLRDIAIIRGQNFDNYGIEFDLIPLASKDNKPFDFEVFYGHVFPHLKGEYKWNTLNKLQPLLSRVYSRSFKERIVASIPFRFGSLDQMNEELPEVKISVNVYLLYSEAKKPTPVVLNKKEIESNNRVSEDSMEVVSSQVSTQEMSQSFSFGTESIQLTKTDDKVINNFEEPGLTLLGFKPRTALMSHIHLKPGFFIFPDESTIKGSTTLFSALLKKCAERDKIPICRLTLKYSTPPRLVALYPQIESKPLGKSGGFNLVFLPFKEDMRNPEIKSTAQPVSADALDLAKNIVDKLSFNYDPNNFPNPVIQTHWRVIEGLALDLESIDPFDDSQTQPDYLDIEEKAGYDLYQLNQLLGGYAVQPIEKKVKVYDDLSDLTRSNKLGVLTVPELKEFCRQKKITSGTKKAEVIEAIRSYYKSINK